MYVYTVSLKKVLNCTCTGRGHNVVYSLVPGVSFDLLQHLYKLEHPTSLCCSAYIRYMHSGPDIGTAGLSVMITPGPQAINQL